MAYARLWFWCYLKCRFNWHIGCILSIQTLKWLGDLLPKQHLYFCYGLDGKIFYFFFRWLRYMMNFIFSLPFGLGCLVPSWTKLCFRNESHWQLAPLILSCCIEALSTRTRTSISIFYAFWLCVHVQTALAVAEKLYFHSFHESAIFGLWRQCVWVL